MSAEDFEDFDKTVDLIEKENAEPEMTQFEIAVSTSASPWPESCLGVKAVLAAVQKMLVAASEGNGAAFVEASYDVEQAMETWGADLFGQMEKP